MRGEDGVVGLDDGWGQLRRGVDHELKLGLLAELRAEIIHEEGREAGAGAPTEGMEHKEALEADAVLRDAANPVHGGFDLLLS